MGNAVTDERLREVYEGGAPFTARELLAIIPEIANEEHMHRLLAATVSVRRLAGTEKTRESIPTSSWFKRNPS